MLLASRHDNRRIGRLAAVPALLGLVVLTAGCDQVEPEAVAISDVPAPAPEVVPVEPPVETPAEPAAPPELTFDSTRLDLGRILETETRRGRFDFTNTGGSDLVIAELKATCGCTVPTLSRDRYAPGERGSIDLVFDPAGPGVIKKYINVLSNVPGGLTKLLVEADVEAFVLIEPRMLRLGTLPFAIEHRLELDVAGRGAEFVVESVRTTNPHVTAVLRPVEGDPGADDLRRWIVEVIIAADAPWGGVFSWLDVDVRGRPAPGAEPIAHRARVRLQGQLFGALAADPDAFRFGAAPGTSFERRIRLRHAAGEPFEIVEARLAEGFSLPDASIDVEPVAGGYDLVLRAAAGDRPRSVRGSVRLTTDVAGEESLVIPIIGVVRKSSGGVQ